MKQTAFILLHKLHRHILPPDRHRYCTYRFAIPPPIPPLIHDCAYGAFYYLGANATTCRRQAICADLMLHLETHSGSRLLTHAHLLCHQYLLLIFKLL
jgi:hypothetical protein